MSAHIEPPGRFGIERFIPPEILTKLKTRQEIHSREKPLTELLTQYGKPVSGYTTIGWEDAVSYPIDSECWICKGTQELIKLADPNARAIMFNLHMVGLIY